MEQEPWTDEQHLPDSDQDQPKQNRTRRVNEVYEWVEWLAGIAIFVVLLLSFVFRTVGVYGGSMENTLLEGDSLIVTQLAGTPRAGDIVAITQPNNINKPLIKRTIATSGQTIDIDFEAGTVTVDGELLQEPYIREPAHRFYDVTFPQTVPEGCIFVMGDNRNYSLDSRASDIGMIDTRYVLGKVLFRFAPLHRLGRP